MKTTPKEPEKETEFFPRDFKGIWIPRHIWLHPDLSYFEKLLWAEIDSLDSEEKGGCYASNEYFQNFFQIKERAVRGAISNLKKYGLIKLVSFNGRERVLTTKIRQSYEQPCRSDMQKNAGKTGKKMPGARTPLPSPPYISPLSDPPLDNKEDIIIVATDVSTTPLTPSQKAKEASSSAIELANLFWGYIFKMHPKAKAPDLKKWALEIDNLQRLDQRSWEDLKTLIDYVFKESDFWSVTLQSPQKLRKHFDSIWIQMTQKKEAQNKPASNKSENIAVFKAAQEALAKKNRKNVISWQGNDIYQNATGDSISLDLHPKTFEEIICRWTGLKREL